MSGTNKMQQVLTNYEVIKNKNAECVEKAEAVTTTITVVDNTTVESEKKVDTADSYCIVI